MNRRITMMFKAFLCVSCLCALCASVVRSSESTYWQDVRPVLRKHCTACHNARNVKETEVSGGVTLDTFEAARKRADDKLVKLLLTPDTEKRMPLGAPPLPA